MRTGDFFDQAVFLASQFEGVVRSSRRLPESALQTYWVVSRGRFDHWGRQLRQCTDLLESTHYAVAPMWRRWTPLLEEILISEMVTRLWSALLEAVDERLGVQEFAPIGHSVFGAHIDARRRVLNLLLRGRPSGLSIVWQLNRRRLTAERWTDLLLSQVAERSWLADYAFDPSRVRRLGGQEGQAGPGPAVLSAASREVFAESAEVLERHVELHVRMHAAMLECLGPGLCLGEAQLLSDWQARLLTLTEDTQGLLAQWFDESAGP
jgi:hypothetical protein